MEEERRFPDGKLILTESKAQSADPSLPAFLARPEGAPVYHGFPFIEEMEIDGWVYGAITEYEQPGGCYEEDGFVVGPD